MDYYEFSSTTPSQIELYGVDFTDLLNTGEMISSNTPVISISVMYGPDSTPSIHLIGSPTVSGNIVYQMIGNCIADTCYCIRFTIQTTFNQTLTVTAQLVCNSTCAGMLL